MVQVSETRIIDSDSVVCRTSHAATAQGQWPRLYQYRPTRFDSHQATGIAIATKNHQNHGTQGNRPIDFWYRPSVLRKPFSYKGFYPWEKFPITKVPLLLQRKKRKDFSYTNYFETTFDCH